jgi:hypothetical protein
VIVTSAFATSFSSHTGVPPDETPTNVLAERPPVSFHPREILATDLLLGIRLGHRKHLPIRAADVDVADSGGLDGVEDSGKQLRGGSRPELVVDHDCDARASCEQLAEGWAVDGLGERATRGLGRVGDRRGLGRPDVGDQVRRRYVQLDRVAVLLGVVVGCADR